MGLKSIQTDMTSRRDIVYEQHNTHSNKTHSVSSMIITLASQVAVPTGQVAFLLSFSNGMGCDEQIERLASFVR